MKNLDKEQWLKICRDEISKGYDGPLLLLSLEQIKKNAENFKTIFPNVIAHYAVKSNPHLEILKTLDKCGINFEIASLHELELLKKLHIHPNRILFSNPVKIKTDIQAAHKYGINWFVADCLEEVIKIDTFAPNANIYLRIDVNNRGADYPLGKKFGCKKQDAEFIMELSRTAKFKLRGLTFHVGSQNRCIDKWIDAIHKCKKLITKMISYGLTCEMLNIGGGFPVQHTKQIPEYEQIGLLITEALNDKEFKGIKLIAEPGRLLTDNAGWMITQVILDTTKDRQKRIYLDTGIFSGLIEPKYGIEYDWQTDRDNDEKISACIAGPTCDSMDIIQENASLPKTLTDGDFVYVPNCAAYTLAYATGNIYGFNGFENPKIKIIN